MKKGRVLTIPAIFAFGGIVTAYFLVRYLADEFANLIAGYDIIPILAGGVKNDVRNLLIVVFPVTVLVYLVSSLPVSFAYILGNKFAKLGAYTQGILPIGKRFGVKRIFFRAVSPALFSLTFGQTIVGLIPDFILQEPRAIPPAVLPLYAPLFSIMSSLIVVNVALFLYVPTWLLEDAGVVYHLKTEELATRRCPDIMGIGRWVSNFLGGFSLLGYPVTAFYSHFYRPFVIHGVPMNFQNILFSVFWTIGLPLLVMAFIMPIIILNELLHKRMCKLVRGLARSLGAKDVRWEDLVVMSESAH